MSNASHRKPQTVSLPRVPVAIIATGAVLVILTGLLLVALAALNAPVAKASTTGYLNPAVSAAKTIRPYWDGRSPVFWTARPEPMCKARYAGRVGMALAQSGDAVVPFAMECEREGDSGPWSWSVLGTRNGQSLSWHQVKRYCHQVGCKRPTAAMLRDLAVSPHARAWMHVGDTAAIYVRTGKNGVTVYIS